MYRIYYNLYVMYCFVCMPAWRTQNWLCLDLSIHYTFGAETWDVHLHYRKRWKSTMLWHQCHNYFISFCPNKKTWLATSIFLTCHNPLQRDRGLNPCCAYWGSNLCHLTCIWPSVLRYNDWFNVLWTTVVVHNRYWPKFMKLKIIIKCTQNKF